jgi:hypothetical protein
MKSLKLEDRYDTMLRNKRYMYIADVTSTSLRALSAVRHLTEISIQENNAWHQVFLDQCWSLKLNIFYLFETD